MHQYRHKITVKDLQEILKACAAGKLQAQEQLYRVYAQKFFGVCLRYANDYAEAEDFLHDAFYKIFKKIKTYRGEGSFEAWMHRILINTILEKFRKRNYLYSVEDISVYESSAEWNETYGNINTKDLMKMIRTLSPAYRMVFNLYAIEGYSHKEISEKLGISVGTSKSNLARARLILQKKVDIFFKNRITENTLKVC
jgi:RNA polymerase sigma factor (sigma-70 family)